MSLLISKALDELKTFIQPQDGEYGICVAFTGHNAAVTIACGKDVLEVIEMERFLNNKNFDFSRRPFPDYYHKTNTVITNDRIKCFLNLLNNYIADRYTSKFSYGIVVERGAIRLENTIDLKSTFKADKWYFYSHHLSHAAGSFYQSKFNKALCITHDGGSGDGALNLFIFDKQNPDPIFLTRLSTQLGKIYWRYGMMLGDIKQCLVNGSLVFPGKIMGLAGYGKVREEWLPYFAQLYKLTPVTHTKENIRLGRLIDPDSPDDKAAFLGVHSTKSYELFDAAGIPRSLYAKAFAPYEDVRIKNGPILEEERIKGQLGYDLAATLQRAFEDEFIRLVMPYIRKHNLPLCISGGCALNILLNTRLVEEYKLDVFVGPDSSDCGLSLGGMLGYLRPINYNPTPYLGPRLLDVDMLATYIHEEFGLDDKDYKIFNDIRRDIKTLAQIIAEGKIIGVARGRAEIGPRALGNRSIICSVSYPDMKDIINSKVKFREWYRPFAPIVREESVDKYFHWNKPSRYMNFSPKVRDEYIEKVKPVVHIDGTSRVQTVTRDQNWFIYDLLGEIEKLTGFDMILNTSFNVDSRPIVSSIKDAIKVLKNTKLDGILIENTLILKNV